MYTCMCTKNNKHFSKNMHMHTFCTAVQHFKMWNMFRHFGVVEGGKRCCQSPTTAQGYRHLPKESTLVTHKHFCFKEKSLSN